MFGSTSPDPGARRHRGGRIAGGSHGAAPGAVPRSLRACDQSGRADRLATCPGDQDACQLARIAGESLRSMPGAGCPCALDDEKIGRDIGRADRGPRCPGMSGGSRGSRGAGRIGARDAPARPATPKPSNEGLPRIGYPERGIGWASLERGTPFGPGGGRAAPENLSFWWRKIAICAARKIWRLAAGSRRDLPASSYRGRSCDAVGWAGWLLLRKSAFRGARMASHACA